MLTGIELMLKRMESHPEEFAGVNGGCSKEWYSVISPVIDHLTGEEKKALEQGLKTAYRDHFNGQVLRKLAGEEVHDKGAGLEDYYGGPSSLFERLNGTTSRDITRAMMDNRVKANGNYSLYESAKATMPSAFGAVPTGKQYNTLGEKYE
jgi:hypothetical protein